ncbi:MAG: hypothetical protein ACREBR_02360 [bacterium]
MNSVQGAKKVGDAFVTKANSFASVKTNNMNRHTFRGVHYHYIPSQEREALDHCFVTREVVTFIKGYFDEELHLLHFSCA